jgi:cytochrome c biogenesis protein CcmG/thiol:disulfide interchange protein DsbE
MRLSGLLPLIIFVLLASLLSIGLYLGNPNEIPSVFIDEPAPPLALGPIPGYREAEGGLSNDLLASGEPSLVNVWASWCAPCRIEHPYLMQWAAARDVPIYGFNYKDEAADAAAFMAELGDPYARIGADLSGRTGIDWGVYGVPETFVIDGKGRVVLKYVGPVDARILRDVIEPAVAEARARISE